MNEIKEFPADDVLSVVTGRLISERHMDGIYEVLSYMAGESVYTHQIPRVSKEAELVLISLYPALRQACDEAQLVTPDNWQQWRATWIERYGLMIGVPKLSADQHERIDPMSELAEHIHPSKIIVAEVER